MTGSGTNYTEDQTHGKLVLRSHTSEIAQLLNWIEGFSLWHTLPHNTQYAVKLCLEEVLVNIMCHGYGGDTERPVVVHLTEPRAGYIVFVVDDEAPSFNPLAAPELPPLTPHEEMRIGGHGLRLLRRFAHTLEYEQTSVGNRMRLGFSFAGSEATTK